VVPDDPEKIRDVVEGWLASEGCDAVVVSGGTGISTRDRTYEAIDGLLDRRLDGFGELFRMLSFEQVGSAAMLSRAVGGIARRTPLFALPGSPRAVQLALDRLILPQLGHLLAELRK
jgi:molybdenum cofactor biosynthesis protein B